MGTLYTMRYLGAVGLGFGFMYIGKGIIVGADAGNGRYHGTYTESGGRIRITGTLSMPGGGSVLVTGAQVPAGAEIPLSADWPANFADGTAQSISVLGSEVQVTFEKVGDIP